MGSFTVPGTGADQTLISDLGGMHQSETWRRVGYCIIVLYKSPKQSYWYYYWDHSEMMTV